MFGKRKKKEEKRVYTHPQFGEMKFVGMGWEPAFKFQLELWDKTYDLETSFLAESENEDINSAQEAAFETVKRLVVEQRAEIEKNAFPEEEGEMAVCDRIIPYAIDFSRKGECAIFFRDMEEEDGNIFELDPLNTGFAITLLPMILGAYPEQCYDWLSGWSDFGAIIDISGTKEQKMEYYGK